jgi:hypothetical protein
VIAVTLGLPFFSLAMIAADAVFLPTSFLRRLGGWAARARGRLSGRGPAGSRAGAPEGLGDGGTATVPGPRARGAGGTAGAGAADAADGKDSEHTHVGFRS